MSFRYINPGYAWLMGNGSSLVQYTDNIHSKTGVSFGDGSTTTYIPFARTSDYIWFRFDMYMPEDGSAVTYTLVPPAATNNARLVSTIAATGITYVCYGYSGTEERSMAGTFYNNSLAAGSIVSLLFRFGYTTLGGAYCCSVNGEPFSNLAWSGFSLAGWGDINLLKHRCNLVRGINDYYAQKVDHR